MSTWFGVISWIITVSGLSTVKHNRRQKSIIDERAEENMGIPDDVCSHHDVVCEDDIG
jgi:hypothetical protein